MFASNVLHTRPMSYYGTLPAFRPGRTSDNQMAVQWLWLELGMLRGNSGQAHRDMVQVRESYLESYFLKSNFF